MNNKDLTYKMIYLKMLNMRGKQIFRYGKYTGTLEQVSDYKYESRGKIIIFVIDNLTLTTTTNAIIMNFPRIITKLEIGRAHV